MPKDFLVSFSSQKGPRACARPIRKTPFSQNRRRLKGWSYGKGVVEPDSNQQPLREKKKPAERGLEKADNPEQEQMKNPCGKFRKAR